MDIITSARKAEGKKIHQNSFSSISLDKIIFRVV